MSLFIKKSIDPVTYCAMAWLMLLTLMTNQAFSSDSLSQLKAMSLENLMQVTVFSASKKNEHLSDVPAAMYVITQEDIRRSGARTLPDLLRGVPGLTVANIDAHTWAISARGFTSLFSQKLLVLMDGRTLYTPLFSGVYWDMQDTLLEDIERIEIIRGPGATIWGANAVNGVINIITRRADETDETFIAAGGGKSDKSSLNGRIGQVGDTFSYRVYAKRLDRDNFRSKEGGEHPDGWTNEKGGFRLDWQPNEKDLLTLQGDIFHGDAIQQATLNGGFLIDKDVDMSGSSLNFEWQRTLGSNSSWSVQSYLDHHKRDDFFLGQKRTTWDISLRHRFGFMGNQDIVWGGGYRYTTDETTAGIASALDPDSRSDEVFNLFIQDDLTLIRDRLRLIVGSKMEHNDYTDFEYQPTVRLIWTPDSSQTVWCAVSRAVRTMSRADSDLNAIISETERDVTITTPAGPITVPARVLLNVIGSQDFKSENLIAYEIGYRTQPLSSLSFDLSTFFHDYKDLRTADPGLPLIDTTSMPVTVTVPIAIGNNMSGKTYGAELSTTWRVNPQWRLTGSYSWLEIDLEHDNANGDPIGQAAEEETPEHQASLRSYVDLPYNLEWDASLFYFSRFGNTSEHLRTDTRFGWLPNEHWELSLKVENLFDKGHVEFANNLGLVSSEVPRNWFAEVKYYF